MKIRNIFTVIASACLTACSDAPFFIANLPTLFSSVRVERDLAYGIGPARKLDLYVPKRGSQQALPVIVFIHGGRWTFGMKAQYAFAADALAKEGFAVAVPGYRKYPQIRFPAFAEDIAEAVSWVHDNIGVHGGDPARIFLAGHSAGAHIAALVAADPAYLQVHHKDRSIIAGFAGLAGPYAFTPEDEDLKDMFGPPDRYPQMQVTTFIDGKQPPMLLMHGQEDTSVKIYNLERLAAAIKAKGGSVATKIYPDVDHTAIIAALTVFLRYKAPVRDDLVSFFRGRMTERTN